MSASSAHISPDRRGDEMRHLHEVSLALLLVSLTHGGGVAAIVGTISRGASRPLPGRCRSPARRRCSPAGTQRAGSSATREADREPACRRPPGRLARERCRGPRARGREPAATTRGEKAADVARRLPRRTDRADSGAADRPPRRRAGNGCPLDGGRGGPREGGRRSLPCGDSVHDSEPRTARAARRRGRPRLRRSRARSTDGSARRRDPGLEEAHRARAGTGAARGLFDVSAG